MRTTPRHHRPRPTGFTLIELAIVVLIIGILLAFVLAVSASSLEQARLRATQTLITKLSAGVEDRIEGLLSVTVQPNAAHQYLASINPPGYPAAGKDLPWGLTSDQRAEVIARLDQIRAELPDVFYLDPNFNTASNQQYPVLFTGLPYPDTATAMTSYVLPLGHANPDPYTPKTYDSGGKPIGTGVGAAGVGPGTGIHGASYTAAAALYKLIGYTPLGCDAVDNGNNNNDAFRWVDDYGEGTSNADGSTNQEAVERVKTFRDNHQHKTARSEMLYAILMEGIGPQGSMFSAEDFRDNEIKDTDNDGVPEFVDGWGEPIQFYRWPFFYRSGGEPVSDSSMLNRPVLQKGDALYGRFETRQQTSLDPNGQLTSLGWWAEDATASPIKPSAKSLLVQNYFVPLTEPYPLATDGTNWDRSGNTARRAYFTKFLILSSGPDRELGVGMLSDATIRKDSLSKLQRAQLFQGAVNAAGIRDLTASPWFSEFSYGEGWAAARPAFDEDFSQDDLSNHNLLNQAGGVQ